MKYLFISLIILTLFSPSAISQVNIPLFSEPGVISQRVGNTNFKILYERPKANGRTIFGESQLVPYGEIWRTGAGPCTKISFDKPVYINSLMVPSGTYSLFTIPNRSSWTLIFNSDTTLYGAYDYDASKDIIRIESETVTTPIWTESFNINLDIRNDIGLLRLSWKDFIITYPIETRTYETLQNEALDIIKNDYPLEEGTYAWLAEYLIHNKIGFGDDYLTLSAQLIDKALKVENENHSNYFRKRLILKLQNNRDEYFRYSKMQINYLEKSKPYNGYEMDVVRIKKEMEEWK